MITLDVEQVEAARQGSRAALEAIVRSMQIAIFNFALRMLAHGQDAEDATQEILIKIVTRLGDLRDSRAAGAWAFRIACRHLVTVRKRGRLEALRLSFRGFAADLEDGLEPLSDNSVRDPETAAMIEEIKVGCTMAMLLCLSRALRAAYILGEIFEMTDAEAADALDIDAAAFRQRLGRARSLVSKFVEARCGIVAADANCRCSTRLAKAQRLGRVEHGRRLIPAVKRAGPSIADIRSSIATLEHGRAAAALMRSNPTFTTDVGLLVTEILRPERA
jgi:RNA polymerase sigma factor (sigma-70 family)